MRAFEQDKVNVKRLWDAGIRFGFGTDSGGASERYFIQGFYEHRQMDLLVQAGLTRCRSFSRSRRTIPSCSASTRLLHAGNTAVERDACAISSMRISCVSTQQIGGLPLPGVRSLCPMPSSSELFFEND